MFNDVQEGSAPDAKYKTNPLPHPEAELPPRQVAAARLIVLGRSQRDVARELGVEEHTVGRWRRTAAFRAELRRQHELALAEQVRQRRAQVVAEKAAAAERIMRKYWRLP